ncbi:M20 family metallopeptidase [Amycolatopsis rubida]|uniref:Probable succinyl-diaminopimelate desuccinylase n=1 Tax=Amycolatopsis rubida TaxID=112413 RepID=A0ABX0BLG7_9PSEU|nr:MULTISPECIES: M20 family metallopeptidase [Amycolatopsis]MYW90677.1 ArgE/DapE family deacylase [Amycolatopsis rubida]NEC55658.1 M20 family metallopeptidase [Amycolatopsis rubida]OAP23729.1 Acetylornithine deacetylase [Amycolatopsis sp. M39]
MNRADLVRQIRAAVDVEAVVGLTRDLVRIRSENPPGRESEIVGHLRERAPDLGLDAAVVETAPGRQNLLLTAGARPGAPVLLVNGHLDTVPVRPDAWRHEPFGGQVTDGRLYGRGSADMKGGVAAALTALQVCRSLGLELPCELVFHLVADEELGGAQGTAALVARDLVHADACLDPEPTGLRLCLAERGLMFATVATNGVPAHGSEPAKGRSAIISAAAIAQVLHDNEFPQNPHPLLGRTTCNVGTIRGGSGPNVVPEECRLEIDRRVLPGETLAMTEQGIVDRIASLGLARGTDYELRVDTFCEPSEIAEGHPFVEFVAAACTAMTGRAPGTTGLPFTTDARFMRNQLAIPSVVFGPGDLAVAHAVDEYVEVDALVTAVGVYAYLFAAFTGTPSMADNAGTSSAAAGAAGAPGAR